MGAHVFNSERESRDPENQNKRHTNKAHTPAFVVRQRHDLFTMFALFAYSIFTPTSRRGRVKISGPVVYAGLSKLQTYWILILSQWSKHVFLSNNHSGYNIETAKLGVGLGIRSAYPLPCLVVFRSNPRELQLPPEPEHPA